MSVTMRPSVEIEFRAARMFCHCWVFDFPLMSVLTLWKITKRQHLLKFTYQYVNFMIYGVYGAYLLRANNWPRASNL